MYLCREHWMNAATSAAVLLALFSGRRILAAEPTTQAVSATAFVVSENRTLTPGAPKKADDAPTLQLELDLSGELFRDAIACSNIRIDQAVTDTGQELQNRMIALRLTDHAWPAPRIAGNVEPRVPVTLLLTGPTRAATRLARVKGTVQVKVGDKPFASTLPRLKYLLDHPATNPDLQKIKISLSLSHSGNAAGTLLFAMDGEPCWLGAIAVVDADGTALARSPPPPVSGLTRTLILPREIDNTMALRLTIFAGFRVISVPFDVRDIPLP